jgi:AraC-like DNA-binding protein
LRSLLKILTGRNTQHIHEKLIEKGKEKLSTTNLSISENAYKLSFEHPQNVFAGRRGLVSFLYIWPLPISVLLLIHGASLKS